jgi:RND family efflux transporter MFP subunit
MPLAPRPVLCAFLLVTAGTAACRRTNLRETESEPPIPVVAEAVQVGSIHGVVSATGVVEALPGADFLAIAPQSGRIVEMPKQVGDAVKAGDLLVRLEFPSLRTENAARAAAAKSLELRLQNAKVAQARVHRLQELGAASQREVDDADAEVNGAETEIADARAAQSAADALGRLTTILAPFSGLVAERPHNPGDAVGTSTSDVIIRVIDPRQVEVAASVAVAQASRFAVGASARGTTEMRSTQEVLRVVSRAEPEAGATTVAVRLAFVVATELAPGIQLGIEIDAEQHSNVPLLPAIAVVHDTQGAAVFVAAGAQARRRAVVTGLSDAERVEILSGVKPGEMVVTQGQSNLRDGSAITIGQ